MTAIAPGRCSHREEKEVISGPQDGRNSLFCHAAVFFKVQLSFFYFAILTSYFKLLRTISSLQLSPRLWSAGAPCSALLAVPWARAGDLAGWHSGEGRCQSRTFQLEPSGHFLIFQVLDHFVLLYFIQIFPSALKCISF